MERTKSEAVGPGEAGAGLVAEEAEDEAIPLGEDCGDNALVFRLLFWLDTSHAARDHHPAAVVGILLANP